MKPTLLIGALALAACAATPPPQDAAAGVKCDANAAQALIGQSADAASGQAQRLSGARTVRRYVSGSPVTQDLRVDRLNVETNAAGTIVRLTCG